MKKPIKATTLALIATAMAAAAITIPATAHADDTSPPPCSAAQVLISASTTQAAVTHRAVPLTFALAADASPCTLTDYPGVDSGAGGPLINAQRTLRGYLGGLPTTGDVPLTVTLTSSQPAHAVVESDAVDTDGDQCATYTDLRVTAPDTTDTVTVAATIDACLLQVHPIGSTT